MDRDTLLKVLEQINKQIEYYSYADERMGLEIVKGIVENLLEGQ